MEISKEEFSLLRNLIEQACGIALTEDKTYLIENRLAKLVAEQGCSTYSEFYLKASKDPDPSLRNKIVDAMTTNETLWFRDDHPFRVMTEHLLPIYDQEYRDGNRRDLRIWSAACSTGQEPYSIVMTILDFVRDGGRRELADDRTEILATDISPTALFLAKAGRYDAISISRGMKPEYLERYFTDKGRVHVLSEDIRNRVKFQSFNLQDSFASFGSFDLVFLRNVAIYFSIDFKRALFDKIADALRPGGHLFLGSAESLSGLSDRFEMCEHGRAIFYRRRN